MDAIKTYLDNVFTAFPQTERVQALKREMLAGMEEKYHTLKQEGKSEHEAVGSVIANFGSIDEIAAELGIEPNTAEPEDSIHLSSGEVDAYLAQTRKSSIWIGFGGWLIIMGVCTMLIINGQTGTDDETFNAVGIFALLLTIAAAFPIFIVNGIRLDRYNHYNQQNIRLDMQTRTELEQQSAQFMPRFIVQISVGVVLIIIAVGALIFLSSLGYENMPLILLLFTTGFAVFLFITAGMTKSVYDILLGRGDYRYKVENKKVERIIATAASVYWPLMVVIFLLWSFIGDAWEISWIVWPVAGIMFGAFCGGVVAWFGTKGK